MPAKLIVALLLAAGWHGSLAHPRSLAVQQDSVGPAAAQSADLPPSHSVAPQLYATGFAPADCLVIDGAGNLYAGNYRTSGTIGRVTPAGEASIWKSLADLAPSAEFAPQAAGLKIDGEGRLIVADAGARRLLRITAAGADALVLADRGERGRFVAPRNLALDVAGNVYLTDFGDPASQTPTGAVYRYNITTGNVDLFAEGLLAPTGVAVAPDQQRLCVAESGRLRLLVFDFAPDKSAVNRRVLLDFPRQDTGEFRGGEFAPAGMVFDAAGRLYVCMSDGGVVNVVDIDAGRLVRQYDAGGAGAVNCHFHGGDLYTTIKSKEAVFRLPLGAPGFIYNRPP